MGSGFRVLALRAAEADEVQLSLAGPQNRGSGEGRVARLSKHRYWLTDEDGCASCAPVFMRGGGRVPDSVPSQPRGNILDPREVGSQLVMLLEQEDLGRELQGPHEGILTTPGVDGGDEMDMESSQCGLGPMWCRWGSPVDRLPVPLAAPASVPCLGLSAV